MVKIAHESPIASFNTIQQYTDYDYALVHLFEENEEYLAKFEEARDKGREIILDNSIFELGEAFDSDRFAFWIDYLKPTWYIVPDSLENAKRTMHNMAEWNFKYANALAAPSKKIGVVQGKTYSEIVTCYEWMTTIAEVDMVAISFDYSLYEQMVPHPNKYVSWMLGRVTLLGKMLRDGVINTDIPHHLLGCGLPQEFAFYKDYDWIYSLDTSNPVVHGLLNIPYTDQGLWDKASIKLFEMINMVPTSEELTQAVYNVQRFRWFAHGSNTSVDSLL